MTSDKYKTSETSELYKEGGILLESKIVIQKK